MLLQLAHPPNLHCPARHIVFGPPGVHKSRMRTGIGRFAKPRQRSRVERRRGSDDQWRQTPTTTSSSGRATAGCLLANRLSADPSVRVLLLEAGGKDNYHWIHIPVGYLYLMGNPRTDWGFKTAAEPGLNGRSLAYPRGQGAAAAARPSTA